MATASGAAAPCRTARPCRSPSTTRATSCPSPRSNRQSKGQFMKTVSRVYDTYHHARSAVAAIEAAGVPSAEVSLVANKYVSEKYDDVTDASKAAKGAGIGGVVGGGAGLLAGLGLLTIPGLGPVVAAGWLASLAVGAAAGATAGGLAGALFGAGTPDDHAHVYSEAVRRGGTLVSARVDDKDADRVQR